MVDDIRDPLDEAIRILDGTSSLLPEKAHLEALNEAYECQKILIMNMLEEIKRKVGNMP